MNDESIVKTQVNTNEVSAENKKDALEKALMKKALGYQIDEIIEEYQIAENNELNLTKRKITTKQVPPDTQALKVLLNIYNPSLESVLDNMTDEELEQEKQKILKLLEEDE